MNIEEKVLALERMLDAVRDEERLNEKIGRLDEQADALAASGGSLALAADATRELAGAARYPPPQALTRAREIHAEIGRARDEIAETAVALVGAEFQALTTKCKELALEASAWARAAWDEVRNGVELPAVDQELLDQLERAGLDVEDVRAPVESSDTDLLLLRSRSLPTLGDLERLMTASRKRGDAVARLQQLLSPDVAHFIVGASKPSGADFTLLTDEVRAFLKEKGIESRYRVRLV